MQTFLPYADFTLSAQCLDDKRLGKQRVECLQTLQTLAKGPYVCMYCGAPRTKDAVPCNNCLDYGIKRYMIKKTPWYNHPAVRMWRGYDRWLYHYYMASIVGEWLHRGFKDTTYESARLIREVGWCGLDLIKPPWLGDEAFHSSHRAALLHKNFAHYSQFNWKETPKLDYNWPVK